MQSITLAPAHVHSIASAVVACGKNDQTPVLAYVQVSAGAGLVSAVATDRYRVVRIQFNLGANESTGAVADLEPVIIDHALLTAFARDLKAAKVGPGLDVTLTVDEGSVTLAHAGGLQRRAEVPTYNFPPAHRLIEDYKASDVRAVLLKPSFIADAAKLSLPSDPTAAFTKDAPWSFQVSDSSGSKPGPVLLSRAEPAGIGSGRIDYMVQPNQILR